MARPRAHFLRFLEHRICDTQAESLRDRLKWDSHTTGARHAHNNPTPTLYPFALEALWQKNAEGAFAHCTE